MLADRDFFFMNKQLLKLAIPNVLTNLTVPLVSLVDVGLMGHMPDAFHIIAIGFGAMLFNFLYWSFGFLRMGTTGITAQAYGAKNAQKLISTMIRAVGIAFLFGLVLILFQDGILQLSLILIEPDAIVSPLLVSYFKIRIFAAPAAIMVYALTGWFLGMQDSKSALVIATIVNGVNAGLSAYLVVFLNQGLEGAAYGTVWAQYIGLAAGIALIWLRHRTWFRKAQGGFEMLKSGWQEFIRVNGDIFIRTLCLIFALSFFKVMAGNAGLILGAANILLLEFLSITAYGIDGFAFAAESICGKFYGKNDKAQFERAVKLSFAWGIGAAFFFSLLFYFFGRSILQVLTDKEEVIDLALIYLPWLVIAPLTNGFAFIWDGVFIGATASKYMRDSMLIAVFIIFLPSFYLLKEPFGNHGIWLALTLFMLARGIIQSVYFKKQILGKLG